MPFADALTPLWARLRARYAQTPLPAFLSWWWSELRACLPRRWQELLRVQEAQVWIHLEQEALQFETVSGGERVLIGTWPRGGETLDELTLNKLLGERVQTLPRIVLLPRDSVLVRRLTFPAAAAGNVRALVGFEIDRQTPFRADQVEYDCRITAAEPGAKQIQVELVVLPRERLEQQLAPLAQLTRQIDAVDVSNRGPGRAGFNLLPIGQRRVRDQRPLLLNLGLIALSAVLLLVAMAQLVDNRLQAVQSLEAEVEAQRTQARATGQLRKSLDDAVAAANFLAEQKAQRPSVLELLRVLTETLPDDTFVERMSFAGDTLSLTVQSASAAKLVELFQNSAALQNPALAGPIQPDPRTGKDRATLTAQFTPPAKEAP